MKGGSEDVETEPENDSPLYRVRVYQKQSKSKLRLEVAEIDEKASIKDVKDRVAATSGIPVDYQQLTLNDKLLSNDDNVVAVFGEDRCPFLNLDIVTPPGGETFFAPEEEEEPKPSYGYNYSYSSNYYGNSYSKPKPSDDSDSEDEDNKPLRHESRRPKEGLVGLKNQGATCYLNSLIQMLFLTPDFRRAIFQLARPYEQLLRKKDKENKAIAAGEPDKKKDIIFNMQMLFAKMQYSDVGAVSTSGLTTSFGWTDAQVFVQQDVQELNRVLIDKLEEKMKNTPNATAIADLYKGVMMNFVKCTVCQRISNRMEDYYDISLVIKNKKDITDSLDSFTEVEVLSGDNAYQCEKCNAKVKAQKGIKFFSVPRVLNLQLKRFEYDWNRDERIKLHDDVKYPKILSMKKFLATPSEIPEDVLEKKKAEDANLPDDIDFPLPSGAKKQQGADCTDFELVGVMVHQGNAAFGHYYAYIKNLADNQWYKFNDDVVTQVQETEVLGGERSWMSSSHKTMTPYMLVYRRLDHMPSTVTKKSSSSSAQSSPLRTSISASDSAQEAEVWAKKLVRRKVHVIYGANEECKVEHYDIPRPIYDYLKDQDTRRQERREQYEREKNLCNITIHRNNLALPKKKFKVENSLTVREIFEKACEAATKEQPSKKLFFRFRRIAKRKNATKRPMQAYDPESDPIYDKKLADQFNDNSVHFYLEQDEDPKFTHTSQPIGKEYAIITMRQWSPEQKRPVAIRDFVFSLKTTVQDLKKLMFEGGFVTTPPEKQVIVEEETERVLRMMNDNSKSLAEFGIICGDMLHVEELNEFHYVDPVSGRKLNSPIRSYAKEYYDEKHSIITIDIAETQKSLTRRLAEAKKTVKEGEEKKPINYGHPLTSEFHESSIRLKLTANKSHLFEDVKVAIAHHLGLPTHRVIRVYVREGFGEGRLWKNLYSKVSKRLQRNKELGIELREEPEDLKKGDQLITLRYHSSNGDLASLMEVCINKDSSMRQLKTYLKERTGVEEDLQVLSEWYNEHFFKMFYSDTDTIRQCRIMKRDILRMDQILDPTLNTVQNGKHMTNIISLQIVQYISWELPYANAYRKEMQTTMPQLFTIDDNWSLFEFRKRFAQRYGVPFWNLNFGFAPHFPIVEGQSLRFMNAIVYQSGSSGVTETPPVPSEDLIAKFKVEPKEDGEFPFVDPDTVSDEQASVLAYLQNRDKKVFNFKAERSITVRKARIRQLEVICWEDLRNPNTKNKVKEGIRGKKAYKASDGEALTIKN